MKRKYGLILTIILLIVGVANIILVGFIAHQFPLGIFCILLAIWWFYSDKKRRKLKNDV